MVIIKIDITTTNISKVIEKEEQLLNSCVTKWSLAGSKAIFFLNIAFSILISSITPGAEYSFGTLNLKKKKNITKIYSQMECEMWEVDEKQIYVDARAGSERPHDYFAGEMYKIYEKITFLIFF